MSRRNGSLVRRGDLAAAWADAEWHPELLSLEPWPHATADTGEFVDRADAAIGTPWPAPLLSDYARYPRDGDRTSYEGAVFARMDRVATSAVAALATQLPRYLDETADGAAAALRAVHLVLARARRRLRAHRRGGGRPRPPLPRPRRRRGGVAHRVGRFALGEALDARFPGLGDRMRARGRRAASSRRSPSAETGTGSGSTATCTTGIRGSTATSSSRAAAFADAGRSTSDRATSPSRASTATSRRCRPTARRRGLRVLVERRRARSRRSTCSIARRAARSTSAGSTGWPNSCASRSACSSAETGCSPSPTRNHGSPTPSRGASPTTGAGGSRFPTSLRTRAASTASPRPPLRRTPDSAGSSRHSATGNGRARPPGRLPLPTSVVLDSLALALAREHEASETGLAIAVKGGHNAENHNHNDVGSVRSRSTACPR